MDSWLIARLAIIFRDDHVLITLLCNLTAVAGILSHSRCGAFMFTASAEEMKLKDQPGLESLTGQPIIGTFLHGAQKSGC
jgi:hypothetical protein